MIYGLYLSANGLLTQGMRADVISNNLANANTHGFKRDFLSLRQRDPEVLRQGMLGSESQRHLLAIGGAVEGDRSHSIHTQGPMQKTGNPLDLAINGTGFFKVRDNDGRTLYTRHGAFTLNNAGLLTLPNGMQVLSLDGEPIEIGDDLRNEVVLDERGRLVVRAEPVAQIAVVDVDARSNLHKLGENLYEALDTVTEAPATLELVPGHLVGSRVSAVREMTALIEANRAYQANAKLISIQDETLGKAISQIAT